MSRWRGLIQSWLVIRELDPVDFRDWVVAEVEGRGLIHARDDRQPAELFREAAQAGGTEARGMLEDAIVAHFIERFDPVSSASGGSNDAITALDRLALALAELPATPARAPVDRLRRGSFAEWANVHVHGTGVGHPLRQTMARAWLVVAKPTGPQLQKMLKDDLLAGPAWGAQLDDLGRAVHSLPAAARAVSAAGQGPRIALWVQMLVDRYGVAAVLRALNREPLGLIDRDLLSEAFSARGLPGPQFGVLKLDPVTTTQLLGETPSTVMPRRIAR